MAAGPSGKDQVKKEVLNCSGGVCLGKVPALSACSNRNGTTASLDLREPLTKHTFLP